MFLEFDQGPCGPMSGAQGPLVARQRVAVVGNAPDIGDHADAIDSCDFVVRFNNAPGFERGSGRRTTHLALVNRGGQMREWMNDRDFENRALVRGAERFVLPFPPTLGTASAASEDGRDWTRVAVRRLRPLGRPLLTLPNALHQKASRALVRLGAAPGAPPSTGFLVVFHLCALPALREARIEIYGFGFAGWEGHPFAAERRWFEKRATEGRLVLATPAP